MVDFNLFQRVGDFFEQRKSFRAQALKNLRKREGLPSPVDDQGNELETRFDDQGQVHYYNASGQKQDRVLFAGAGKDGKPGAFAVGQRRGDPLDEATRNWASGNSAFEILDVAEDGRKIEDELKDLDRDSSTFALAETVSHGAESEQAPGFEIAGTSDEEVDLKLQEFLKRGPR